MRTIAAAAVACLSIVGLAVAADVQASIKKDISIPAGRLGSALQTLSEERHIHVIFLAEDVNKFSTRGVRGSFTIDEALKQLLGGTGLAYQYIDAETVSILPLATAPVSGASSTSAEATTSRVVPKVDARPWRVAQVTNESRANPDEPKDQKVEEITVTAQKRMERLHDVPISISVLGGPELDRSTAEGITEALRAVPGVATSVAVQGGGTQLAVRGVTATNPLYAGASPVAYYLDSVPVGLSRMSVLPDANVYDLERVEVLRGPQGTLYGANALNGVVRILTKDPVLNELELKGRTSVASTRRGAESFRGDVALNLPIVEGKLAARAVVGYQALGGWIDRPNEKDANGAELANLRLKIGAQPTAALSIVASARLSRSDYDQSTFSPDNEQIDNVLDEPVSTDYDIYDLKLGYELERFSITSTTSYFDYASDSFMDLTSLFGFDPPDGQRTLFESQVFSQEVNLSSTHRGAWRWSLGGIYRDAEDRDFETLPPFYVTPYDLTQMSESFALFGEVTRTFLNERWALTGGLRYFEDQMTSREDGNTTTDPVAGVYERARFSAVTPRVVLAWHPQRQSTVYASYSEGFRSGFSQEPFIIAFGIPPVEPDTLANYELGAKGRAWGGRLDFDAAVFYIDWQDAQQSLLVPFGSAFTTAGVNGDSASGIGLEFGASAEVVDGLTLSATLSWNDLTFDSDVFSGALLLFPKGSRLNFSPETTASASIDYVFPLGSAGYDARLSASANYTSKIRSLRVLGGTPVLSPGDAMLFGRVGVAIDSPRSWTATLFVDNINDEDGAFIHDWLGAPAWDMRTRPRTIGLQLEYRP